MLQWQSRGYAQTTTMLLGAGMNEAIASTSWVSALRLHVQFPRSASSFRSLAGVSIGAHILSPLYIFLYLSYTTQLLAASSRLEKFVPDTLEDMASDIGQDALTTITRDQAVYDAASQAAQAAEVKLCLLVPMIMVNTFIQVTEAGLCYVF